MVRDEMKVEPVVLEGSHVRLEPLTLAHHAGLCEVGLEEELWRWIPTPVRTDAEMAAYIETALKSKLAERRCRSCKSRKPLAGRSGARVTGISNERTGAWRLAGRGLGERGSGRR
jgi:hypothetical protein